MATPSPANVGPTSKTSSILPTTSTSIASSIASSITSSTVISTPSSGTSKSSGTIISVTSTPSSSKNITTVPVANSSIPLTTRSRSLNFTTARFTNRTQTATIPIIIPVTTTDQHGSVITAPLVTFTTIAGGQVIVNTNGVTVTEPGNVIIFTEPNGNVVTQTEAPATGTETGVPVVTANAAVRQAFSFGALEAFVATLFWVL